MPNVISFKDKAIGLDTIFACRGRPSSFFANGSWGQDTCLFTASRVEGMRIIVMLGMACARRRRGAPTRTLNASARVALSGSMLGSLGSSKSPDARRGCSRSSIGPMRKRTSAHVVSAFSHRACKGSNARLSSAVKGPDATSTFRACEEGSESMSTSSPSPSRWFQASKAEGNDAEAGNIGSSSTSLTEK